MAQLRSSAASGGAAQIRRWRRLQLSSASVSWPAAASRSSSLDPAVACQQGHDGGPASAGGGSSDSGRMVAATTASGRQQWRGPVAGGGDGAGQRVCGSGGTPRAGAAAATPAAELVRATSRGPRRQRSGRSDGGDELVPACGSGLVGPTNFFVFGKCLPSASFNTRQNFYRVREEKHSAKVPFADVCLPCVVCREQHTTNILPWGK